MTNMILFSLGVIIIFLVLVVVALYQNIAISRNEREEMRKINKQLAKYKSYNRAR